MDSVTLARALFGTSLAFHIIFATLGVGIPVMIFFAELLLHLKKDRDYAILAKRWTKCLGILLGVAIPSGTIVGVMLSLLWPGFMKYVGQVIALPFQLELYAFFLEALFMSIYVYAADRLSPILRIISMFFIATGAGLSAVLITDAHSFMNTPRGFTVQNDGAITDVHPWEAVLNPSFWVTANHVTSTAIMTGAFAVVSVGAYKLAFGKPDQKEAAYHLKGILIALVLGGVMSLYSAVNGHATAQNLHHNNPEKLAAAEGLFVTQSHAPLAVFGRVDPAAQEVIGGIKIPSGLSFLAGNSFNTVVRGLNDFPREDWPPLFVHSMFDMMVTIGMVLIFLSFLGVFYRFIRKKTFPRWLLWAFVATGPLSMFGIETGWVFSCSARQPWTIYHVLRTGEAAVRSNNLGQLFVLFVGLYVVLLFLTGGVTYLYFKRNPVSADLSDSPADSGSSEVKLNG